MTYPILTSHPRFEKKQGFGGGTKSASPVPNKRLEMVSLATSSVCDVEHIRSFLYYVLDGKLVANHLGQIAHRHLYRDRMTSLVERDATLFLEISIDVLQSLHI